MPTLAEDRDAIRDLHARYSLYVDTAAAEHYASLFTEDGSFELTEGNFLVGREALAAFAATLPVDTMHHMMTNEIIDVSGDRGTCTSSVIIFSKGRIVQTLHAYDELKRVDGSWKIARRTYKNDPR